MTTAAPARPKTNGTGQGKGAPAPAARPFITGSRRVDKQTYDETRSTTTTTVRLPTYELDTDGFTSGLYILCEAVTAGNSAATTFEADGPFIAYDTVQLSDTSNNPIIGPMTGHDLYECVKYGGYSHQDDAKNSPIYSATTGAGATGGSFTFCLLVPIEIVHRDALGSLTNKSASAVFKLDLTLSDTSTIYGTNPTNAPSVRTRIQQYGWMDPNAADMKGNPVAQAPPAINTTQYWDKQSYTLNAGSISPRLQTFDGLVRNFIFELRDSTGSRQQGDSDFPDPFTLLYETSQPISRMRPVWRDMIGRMYGYNGTTPEVAGARDYGVYPEPYTLDFGLKPGAESRMGYLPVSAGTSIRIQGTITGSGSHTLYVFVNSVIPPGGDVRALAGR